MITRIVLVAAVLLAVMVTVKDGRALRAVGLTGSCALTQTDADGIRLETCSAGTFSGAPSLAGAGCTATGTVAGRVYWRCPPR
jgi:hypothetical protein